MLSVHNWIKLDSLIRCFKSADETLVVGFQIENEKETATSFEDVAGFASGKDDDRVVDDG